MVTGVCGIVLLFFTTDYEFYWRAGSGRPSGSCARKDQGTGWMNGDVGTDTGFGDSRRAMDALDCCWWLITPRTGLYVEWPPSLAGGEENEDVGGYYFSHVRHNAVWFEGVEFAQ